MSDRLICKKCKNVLLNDPVKKKDKMQCVCSCGEINYFDKITISSRPKLNYVPDWVDNYKYDDTVKKDGIILV
jgi:hypothetical protein